jgi:hypothetical protein
MEPIGDPDDDVDFAEEHEDTTVDERVTSGEDDAEPERPQGWDGLDKDGPP